MRPYTSFGGAKGSRAACPTAFLPRTTTPWDLHPVLLSVGYAFTPGRGNDALCHFLFRPFDSPMRNQHKQKANLYRVRFFLYRKQTVLPNEVEGLQVAFFRVRGRRAHT